MIRTNVETHGSGFCLAKYRIDEQGRSLFIDKIRNDLLNVLVFPTKSQAEAFRAVNSMENTE
jgi:hypothetical protein